jgi:hypothetical protein
MAERDLATQQFESETAKLYPETIGKPLIVNKAQANDAILQNFDAYVDATGKETFGLRETGKVVDKALVNQVNKAKADIRKAYTSAREAGEMQEPVPYVGITQYIEKQTPTVRAKLAPILDAVDEQIKINGKPINTPDFLIKSQFVINGKKINWIDAKNFYGSNIKFIKTKINKQIVKYNQAYGSGCIIFSLGYNEKYKTLVNTMSLNYNFIEELENLNDKSTKF